MEGSQKDTLSSEFPPWATGLMPMGNPGMSGSKGEHMLVSYHQKVRELGYFYTCQSLAEDFWGREGTWWVWLARGNFQTKKDWWLKVELVDDSALKWKHPRGYGQCLPYIFIIRKKTIRNLFFFKGEKYDLNKRIFISISNRYVYVFRYVVRFYFSHKVSLTGSGMHYLNMGSKTLVLHYMQTSVLRRELSKVEGGKH